VTQNTDVDTEKEAQFERDRQAFKSLSPRAQRWARWIATGAFAMRKGFVGATKGILAVVEEVFRIFFTLPYTYLAKGVKALANGAVRGLMLGIGAASSGARRLFPGSAGKITVWEKRTVTRIDEAWQRTKKNLEQVARRAGRFAEYYGALGLYRGASWVLNPRTPSGRPLMGNETLNRAVGATAALGVFVVLSYQLTKLAVMAKLWHLQFAQSFVTDAGPLYLKVLKQAMFHPLLTGGLTAAKFMTLPVIAASREAMKSTPFAQGIAFHYNARLKEHRERAGLVPQKKISAFIRNLIIHIIEKASPEFYRARQKYYVEEQSIGQQHNEELGVQKSDVSSLSSITARESFNGNTRNPEPDSPPPEHHPSKDDHIQPPPP
jgi:hypothetical protein